MNVRKTIERGIEKVAKEMVRKADLPTSVKKFICYDCWCNMENSIKFYYNNKFVFSAGIVSSDHIVKTLDELVDELEKQIREYASKLALQEALNKK